MSKKSVGVDKKKATEIGTLVILSYQLRKQLLDLDIKRDAQAGSDPENLESIGDEIEVAEKMRESISKRLRKYGVEVLI